MAKTQSVMEIIIIDHANIYCTSVHNLVQYIYYTKIGGVCMDHGPVTEWKEDKSSPVKARLGVWMFLVYSIVYAGFILINVLNPKLMGRDIGSFNLAIIYGLGLIVLALILSLTYNHICTRAEERLDTDKSICKGGIDCEL